MRHKLNELPFYQKDPSFFDAIFEAHLPYFEQKEISSFELVLYKHTLEYKYGEYKLILCIFCAHTQVR